MDTERQRLFDEYQKARECPGEKTQATAKEVTKLQGEIISLRHSDTRKLTEDMIRRAREYPFENLLEVNRNHMALCFFRSDKNPSFSIKNNFGYCFSCQWKGNTIDFLMERDGLSFPEAVKRLQ